MITMMPRRPAVLAYRYRGIIPTASVRDEPCGALLAPVRIKYFILSYMTIIYFKDSDKSSKKSLLAVAKILQSLINLLRTSSRDGRIAGCLPRFGDSDRVQNSAKDLLTCPWSNLWVVTADGLAPFLICLLV